VGLPADKCVVVEDSLVGLRAALGANMPCIITPCPSSDVPDFLAEGAKAVMDTHKAGASHIHHVLHIAPLFAASSTT